MKDPKQAFQKTQELWTYLSEPEPGNQARPETLEQLVVLLTRETARRIVHFINFTRNAVTQFPETLKQTQYAMMQQLIQITKSLAQLIRTRPITTRVSHEVAMFQAKINGLYDEVQNYATNRLVNTSTEDDEEEDGQSLALVPFQFPDPRTNDGTGQRHHHRLFPTNNNLSANEIHLTFQCAIHTVISAVSERPRERKYQSKPVLIGNSPFRAFQERIAIYVSGRLSEEKALARTTILNNHIANGEADGQ